MITVTKLAADKIKENLLHRGESIGIHIGVKTTGCNGLSYTMKYADKIENENTTKYIQDEFVILIDNKSLKYLDDITLDWSRKGLNEGFDFINPKEKTRCGCGESFNI